MTHTLSIIYALLLCASAVHSAQVVPGVQMATTSSLTLPVSPATLKQTVLTWDNPPGASNRVSWGVSRFQWTNTATLTTNRCNVTNGICYAITSIVGGIESVPALWPSNRLGEIWLTDTKTNIARLERFTNSPPEAMRFWGVVNITTGWE